MAMKPIHLSSCQLYECFFLNYNNIINTFYVWDKSLIEWTSQVIKKGP